MKELVIKTINNEEGSANDILKGAKASSSKSRSRIVGEAGVISIVKAKTGNRNILSNELREKLNNPEKVQVAFAEDSIIIAEKLPNNDSSFNIKRSGVKGIIYSTQLVNEITELFELDFSCRTSITFNEVEYFISEEYPVAIVKVK